MKKIILVFILLFTLTKAEAQNMNGGYPITPVPFTSVKVTDNFWGDRMKAGREVTIPIALKNCYETGRVDNFKKAGGLMEGYYGTDLPWDDTDLYKIIEGASYSIQNYPDKKLEAQIDSLIYYIEKAQEPDGYIFTARTAGEPGNLNRRLGEKRWEKTSQRSHELYNCGHLFEAAVAHYEATGKHSLLNVAIKCADLLVREFGPGKLAYEPGHQIVEMGLVKMYRATGKKDYLSLAKFFLDLRGNGVEGEYSQTHKPVVEQDEAVGHAVRAVYMYSGMADVAALTGDTAYIKAIDKIWDNVVSKKIYIIGGIGATREGEAFGANYELPNLTAYNETCAAIGNVYWNHRLFLMHGDAKYYDVLERTLYNGLISGVSLDGGSFLYPNPLEADGIYLFNKKSCTRQEWFGCACCPSNVCRFIPSIPSYIYAVRDNDVYVNLFMGNTSELNVTGKKVTIKQTTGYPWEGDVRVEVIPHGIQSMALKIRIPGWARNTPLPSNLYTYTDGQTNSYNIKLNGKVIKSKIEKGYFTINRTWKKGDIVEISFDMKPRTVKAHDKVEADQGRIAFERGPIVYCAEWPDNKFHIPAVLVNTKSEIQVIDKPDMLHGIKELKTLAQALSVDQDGVLKIENVALTLIPYYAWLHRGCGQMSVWFPRDVSAVKLKDSSK
ncbi:glycoside hydrolase family 127 protein [Bacteroides ovatus]|uniref:glycoside hydrolase family 127 protein n=1 Tax=Bacteroides ovatus TaxID=28116 RepID=UPI0031454192